MAAPFPGELGDVPSKYSRLGALSLGSEFLDESKGFVSAPFPDWFQSREGKLVPLARRFALAVGEQSK